MIDEANHIEVYDRDVPKIGIVGEIYVKYNKFGHRFISDKLVEEGVEVVFPPILEFFTQEIVNVRKNWEMNLSHRKFSVWVLLEFFKYYINNAVSKAQKIMEKSKYKIAFENIKDVAREAEGILSLNQGIVLTLSMGLIIKNQSIQNRCISFFINVQIVGAY